MTLKLAVFLAASLARLTCQPMPFLYYYYFFNYYPFLSSTCLLCRKILWSFSHRIIDRLDHLPSLSAALLKRKYDLSTVDVLFFSICSRPHPKYRVYETMPCWRMLLFPRLSIFFHAPMAGCSVTTSKIKIETIQQMKSRNWGMKDDWGQPRSQGPVSSSLEKVPWLWPVTCLLDFCRFQICDWREGLESLSLSQHRACLLSPVGSGICNIGTNHSEGIDMGTRSGQNGAFNF